VLETTSSEPAISIMNSRNLTLDHVQISGNATKALKIEGPQTGAIHLHDTDVETRGIETGVTVQKGILIKK
jgi:hypothetical protein